MATEQTLSIIKPDAVARGLTERINAKFRQEGLSVVAQKEMQLTEKEAALFYQEHKERPFFQELLGYITSEPVVVQVLEGENAVKKNREIMGATDPKEAASGTIRAEFATSKQANSVHGSDSLESAKREVDMFFTELELTQAQKLKQNSKSFVERIQNSSSHEQTPSH